MYPPNRRFFTSFLRLLMDHFTQDKRRHETRGCRPLSRPALWPLSCSSAQGLRLLFCIRQTTPPSSSVDSSLFAAPMLDPIHLGPCLCDSLASSFDYTTCYRSKGHIRRASTPKDNGLPGSMLSGAPRVRGTTSWLIRPVCLRIRCYSGLHSAILQQSSFLPSGELRESNGQLRLCSHPFDI